MPNAVDTKSAESWGPTSFTQHDLALAAGIGQNTVSRLAAGHDEPRPATIRKLAHALSVAPTALIDPPSRTLAAALRQDASE